MLNDPESIAMMEFVRSVGTRGIESTGATRVNYTGGLYNVSGSTDDPKHVPNNNGVAWKQLLINYGINGQCYVTNANPGGSHPDFSVGGHMTPNQNGVVATGGVCYLMPLCHWHNSTSRNGVLFSHTNSNMLRLSGYMQGELALTFQIRLPSSEPFALLCKKDGEWSYRDLSQAEAKSFDALPSAIRSEHYILIERVRGEETLHYIRDQNLPV